MKTAATKITKAKICTRDNPCNCGCHGRDPWHKQFYTRTIKVTEYNKAGRPILGVVRLPFSNFGIKVEVWRFSNVSPRFDSWQVVKGQNIEYK
jgi:hypothetical protein